MTSRSLWGFTLLELLIVISLIIVLSGMLMAGLSILKRQQKVAMWPS